MSIERYRRLIAVFCNAEAGARLLGPSGMVFVRGLRRLEPVAAGFHQLVPDDDLPAQAGCEAGAGYSTWRPRIAYDFSVPHDTPQETRSDAEIAAGLLTGDEKAFTEFVKAFHSRLAQYSFLMCGQREDAEEVAQETLLKVFASIDQLRDPNRLKAWVFRIARNECFMKRRKSVFAPQTELSLDDLKPRRLGEDRAVRIEIADWSSLPDNLLLDAELQDAVARSIQQLPEIYRSVVLLRDVEELTTDETAEILEIGTDAVKTRLHRGRLALRQHLDQYLRSRKGGRAA